MPEEGLAKVTEKKILDFARERHAQAPGSGFTADEFLSRNPELREFRELVFERMRLLGAKGSLAVDEAEGSGRTSLMIFRYRPAETYDLPEEYEVRREIGRGGAGVVLLARHTVLQEDVAIKLLHPWADVEERQRFLQEIALLYRELRHPRIMPVIYAGLTTAGSVPYFVMPYSSGAKNLDDLVSEEGRLSVVRSLKIALQMAEGLAAAHAAGVIHRDVKPGNVLVLPDDDVKLLDLGIAKWLSRRSPEEQIKTQTGVIVGTPYYMPPERFRQEGSDDPRGDIYSLGATLYEMAAGRPPFSAGPERDRWTEIEGRVRKEPLDLGDDVWRRTPGLRWLVTKCMWKDPKHRFSTAGALLEAVRGLLAGM